MSAGAVQLAAIGQEDAYLTGDPSVTYFSGVYRRHTPFSMQSFNIPFQGEQVQWGSQGICRIPYKGDQVRGATLAVTLPALSAVTTDYIWPLSVQLQRPIPYLVIDGVPRQVDPGVLDVYSTVDVNKWICSNVTYNSSLLKFVFTGSTVSLNVADATTVGVFWGLDPHSYSSKPTSNTLQWDISPTSAHGPTADFTLVQSGWTGASAATLPNLIESLVMNTASPVTLSVLNPTSAGYQAQFLNLNLFGTPFGYATTISITPGGCIRFSASGPYVVTLALGVNVPVSRVGIGHWNLDGHPSGTWVADTPKTGQWAWNDYTYSWLVMPLPITPIVVIPINVTDPTQYYFIDVETQFVEPVTISDGSQGTEIQVSDVNDYLYLNKTSSALVNSTINLASDWSISSFLQIVQADETSDTFKFGSSGVFTLRGTLYTSGANISSVKLSNSTSLVTAWHNPIGRTPTINFTLPVHNTTSTETYRITVDADAPVTLIKQTWICSEQIGVPTGTAQQPSSFKKNGLLFTANTLTQVDTGTHPVHFSQDLKLNGTSQHIVTRGGNIQFSNVGIYKFQAYFETTDAYVTGIGLFQSSSDTRPANPVYQVTSQLSLGTVGPYTLDVLAPCNDTSNVFFLDVLIQSNSGLSNITANAFVTIVGTTAPKPNTYQYVDSVGTYLLESAELRIGGQLIEQLTGEAIELYNDLYVPQENQPGLTLLTGKLDTSQSIVDRTYYVNLPFYFYGNPELSVPVCALTRQDMEIYVKFRPFSSLIATSSLTTQQFVQASIIVEYVYLSDPEVDWFRSHDLDYVIQQVQYGTYNLGESTVVNLDFTAPVREILFVVQDVAAAPYVYVNDPGLSIGITLNGEDYIDSSTADYQFLHLVAPLEKHSRQPDRNVYCLPFARRPQDPRPSGSINMSRIKQKKFQIFLPGTTSLATKQLRVVAMSHNIMRISNGLAGLLYQ
jgi:Large eukaryotic DNA virus major capsid protein/Major capsid protein N-terminus